MALPTAVVTAASHPPPNPEAMNGPAAAVLRLYTEETATGENSSWYCLHLVALSTQAQPQMLTFRLTDLPDATRGRTLSACTIFDESYPGNITVDADGTAVFADFLDSFYTKVYRLGCERPAPDPDNAVSDPSFEGIGATVAGWAPLNGMTNVCKVGRAPGTERNVSGYYPLCNPRLHIRFSTAGPHSSRHCAHIQIPSAATAQLSFPLTRECRGAPTVTQTSYEAAIWARSAPALMSGPPSSWGLAAVRTAHRSRSRPAPGPGCQSRSRTPPAGRNPCLPACCWPPTSALPQPCGSTMPAWCSVTSD